MTTRQRQNRELKKIAHYIQLGFLLYINMVQQANLVEQKYIYENEGKFSFQKKKKEKN